MATKHSKYKNTGILFELLVRQVTNDTINGVKKNASALLNVEKTKDGQPYINIKLQDPIKKD